jgi:P-type E1-E2 ATPase
MLEIVIPSRAALRLECLVLDLNGTIALDGQIIPGVSERLELLGALLDLWLVSADTQGTLASLAASLKAQARLLQPGDEAIQKAALVEELGPWQVVAIGNGANDAAMLRRAALGMAVMGNEGLATACLSAADVIASDIETGLDLLPQPRRLIATLRT